MNRSCRTDGEKRAYRVSAENPEGKRPLRRWENIKWGLKEIGWRGMDWIHLAQDRDL
jgi:hypothetical protein